MINSEFKNKFTDENELSEEDLFLDFIREQFEQVEIDEGPIFKHFFGRIISEFVLIDLRDKNEVSAALFNVKTVLKEFKTVSAKGWF